MTTRLGLPQWTNFLEEWLATKGLNILIWILGGILLVRFVRWIGDRYDLRVDKRFHRSDAIVQSEDAKHQRALVDVVVWTVIAMIAVVVVLHILSVFGVRFSALVGPSAVVGAALGFGAQRIVQDVLAGFFIVAERQYGYGDVVNLTITSASVAEGTVEDVTLRVTRLRTSDGEMIIVPNGQILKVNNLSREWARAVVDVPVPADADITVVNETLTAVGKAFYRDPHWHRLLLDAPAPLGVTNLELDSLTVRMVARTLPGKQFDVSRALRVRIVQGLARSGITVAAKMPAESTGEA
ncbi:mechanosensitive ion channel family protein [Gordonia alkaliphila]|uniref:mechanosensitive ion channel family protein n=1 Tax=Gordonia alkaliphila TaxID=1053547 RepID=UPI001FF34C13|nr:mechanosensitive ion channel family protein [Gordonia alkaliphila]MCK0438244.1 mechanosensitive ion channel family protein [Gordonia alkaliphila]